MSEGRRVKTFTLTPEEAERALPKECPLCNGLGRFMVVVRHRKCPECDGRGYTPGVVLVAFGDDTDVLDGLPTFVGTDDFGAWSFSDGSGRVAFGKLPPVSPGEEFMVIWNEEIDGWVEGRSKILLALTVEPVELVIDSPPGEMIQRVPSAWYWRIETAPRGEK